MTIAEAPLLSVRDLSKTYHGKRHEELTALDHVDFELAESETLGVVGESGSGKSTLAKLVAGIIAPTTGEMTFLGEPLGYHRRNSLRRQIQYIYQEPVAALDPKMSVQRIIEEPIRLYYDYSAPDRQELAVSLLKDVGLSPDLRTRRPKELSGGQCQRIGIARALAGNPKVLVCDEPTSALDSTIQAQILDLMRELKEQKGFAYIFITHSLGVVRAVSNRIMVVQRGRIVESGSTSQILDDPRSEYTRTLLASVPRIDIPYYEI